MTEQPPPPRGSAAEFDDRRNARLYDLTQPLIINKTPICQAVAELFRQRPRTLRIAELGCGTGLFSLPVLAALDSFDYLGLDAFRSHDSSLARKLERQPAPWLNLIPIRLRPTPARCLRGGLAIPARRGHLRAVPPVHPHPAGKRAIGSSAIPTGVPSTLLQQTTGRRAIGAVRGCRRRNATRDL